MGRIPEDVINQLREGTPIEDVIGEFVQLRKTGSTFKALCPFHEEKTPSFNVNPRMGIYKCFGCGAGGDAIRFLMEHEGLSFREALNNLAKRQGVDLSPYDQVGSEPAVPSEREKIIAANLFAARFYWKMLQGSLGSRARSYLNGREVSQEAREAFRIGYAPARWDALYQTAQQAGFSIRDLLQAGLVVQREDGTGVYDRFRDRVMFPILNMEGGIIGFGGRSLPDSDSRHATAKYLNSSETAAFRKGRVLYGFYQGRQAIREEKRVLVTEGYFDVISLWQNGFPWAVAPLGTALTSGHLRILRAQTEEIVFVFDSDKAGEAASERAGNMASRLMGLAGMPDHLVAGEVLRKDFIDRDGMGAVRLKVVALPKGQDVDDVLQRGGADAFSSLLENSEGLLEHTVQAAMEGMAPGAGQAEKLDSVRSLLPVLGACHSSVREQYFALLEDRLGIPFPTLASSVQRMLSEESKEPALRAIRAPQLLGRSVNRPRAEIDVVRMLLVRPELAEIHEVTPSLFRDPAVREFVGALRAASMEGRTLHPAALADKLEDPSARALVLELAAEDIEYEDVEAEFSECLHRFEIRMHRQREEAISKEIEYARTHEGEDSPTIRRLLEEKNALWRERKRIIAPG